MGRIKTVGIRNKTKEIFRLHKDKFTTDFEKNKQILMEVASIPSKKIRNQVAGYITKLKKTVKDWEVN